MYKFFFMYFVCPILLFGQTSLVRWDNTNFTPTIYNSHLSAQNLTAGSGMNLSFESWAGFRFYNNTNNLYTSGVYGANYIQFVITTESGYSVLLDRFLFKYQADSGSSTANSFQLAYSTASDFSSDVHYFSANTVVKGSDQIASLPFPSNTYLNSGTTYYFRLYIFADPENQWSELRIRNSSASTSSSSVNFGPTFFGTVSDVSQSAPIAVADAISTTQNNSVYTNVLSNDVYTSVNQIVVTQYPTNGAVSVIDASNIIYFPNSNFVGSDGFKYKIINSNGESNEANVSLRVYQNTNSDLVRWQGSTTAVNLNPTIFATGVTSSVIVSSGAAVINEGYNWGDTASIIYDNWQNSGTSLNASYYIQYKIAPDNLHQIKLNNFHQITWIDGGPQNYKIYYSKTGAFSGEQVALEENGVNTTTQTSATYSFPSNYYVYPGEAVYVRIYAYNPANVYWSGTRFLTKIGTSGPAFNGAVENIVNKCPYATTWNGSSWSNSEPTLTTEAILNGNYNTATNGAFSACRLTINQNYVLNIAAQTAVKIKNEIINNGSASNFVIEDQGNLLQINDPTVANSSSYPTAGNIGAMTYNRTTAKAWAKDFIYLSSVVEGQQLGLISNQSGYNFNKYYSWNTAGSWTAKASSVLATKGLGYIARIPNGWTAGATYNMALKGVPNNGTIGVAFKGGSGTSNTNKWNLLGNPYPSALSAKKFISINQDLMKNGTFYFWAHANGTGASTNPFYYNNQSYSSNPNNHYIAKNLTGKNPVESTSVGYDGDWNGLIPSAQGFFVLANPNISTNIIFNNDMRTDGNNGGYYRTSSDEKYRFWLELVNVSTSSSVQALVGYVDGATNGLDFSYDGLVMSDDLNLYSILSTEEKLSIQGRELPFSQDDVVPIGLKLPSDGSYKIALRHTDGGLFAPEGDQIIYLKDKLNNITYNLNDAPVEFSLLKGTINDRFEIVYKTDETLGNVETQVNEFVIYRDKIAAQWVVKSPKVNIQTIEIYDISGQLVLRNDKVDNNTFSISESQLGNHLNVIRVKLKNGQIITRKILQ